MTVARIYQQRVDLARIDENAHVAAQRMLQRGVGTLVIVEGAGSKKPAGIVTDRDLVLRVLAPGRDPRTTLLGEIMTEPPRTITAETSIGDAVELMRTHALRRLPVVDAAGDLIGIVSLDDVLTLFADEFSAIAELLRRESPGPAAGAG